MKPQVAVYNRELRVSYCFCVPAMKLVMRGYSKSWNSRVGVLENRAQGQASQFPI